MPTTTVMTRSITAQLRAAASMSSQRSREAIEASIVNQRSTEVSSEDEESSSSGYDNSETDSNSQLQTPSTPPSLRMPLGSCNGVGSLHHQQQNGAHKRHQSHSPVPSGQQNGRRSVTPPHTPPKLLHQNGHASPYNGHSSSYNGHTSPYHSEAHSRESSPPSRCAAPKSPPTPHRIKFLEEKENEKKPKKNLIKSGSLNLTPVAQQNGHKPEPVTATASKTEPVVVSNGQQTKLTSFFPIRRSERRPKTEVEAKQQKIIEDRLHYNNDAELGLKVQYFSEKGRGVTSTKRISKGDFVVEYVGDLIDVKAAKERESKYAMDLSKGCYMYYFKANNRQYCIDATSETGRLGRLVNHSRLTPNLQTKVLVFNGTPRLILVARRDIEPGEELLYDYGDRSKESLEAHPWLAL